MRILYVEDHARFRDIVIRQFLAAHEVIVAPTLHEARRLLAAEHFDAVLLDHDLPDGKGTELLEDIRQQGLDRRVIAVSSFDDKNAGLLAAGAVAAVSKLKFAGIEEVLKKLEAEE